MKIFRKFLLLASLLTSLNILCSSPCALAGGAPTGGAGQKAAAYCGDGFRHVPNRASADRQTQEFQPENSPFAAARRSARLRAGRYSDSELWERAYNAGLLTRRRHYYSYCCDPFWWPRLGPGWNWGGPRHPHHQPRPPHHRR